MSLFSEEPITVLMATSVATSILELVAILLTLLFIAIQYASRKGATRVMSEKSLSSTMKDMQFVAFLLIVTAFAATVVLLQEFEDGWVGLMLLGTGFALIVIALSIRNTARRIANELDTEEDTTPEGDEDEGDEEGDGEEKNNKGEEGESEFTDSLNTSDDQTAAEEREK